MLHPASTLKCRCYSWDSCVIFPRKQPTHKPSQQDLDQDIGFKDIQFEEPYIINQALYQTTSTYEHQT